MIKVFSQLQDNEKVNLSQEVIKKFEKSNNKVIYCLESKQLVEESSMVNAIRKLGFVPYQVLKLDKDGTKKMVDNESIKTSLKRLESDNRTFIINNECATGAPRVKKNLDKRITFEMVDLLDLLIKLHTQGGKTTKDDAIASLSEKDSKTYSLINEYKEISQEIQIGNLDNVAKLSMIVNEIGDITKAESRINEIIEKGIGLEKSKDFSKEDFNEHLQELTDLFEFYSNNKDFWNKSKNQDGILNKNTIIAEYEKAQKNTNKEVK